MYESRRFFTTVVVLKGINPGFPLLWGGVLMLMLYCMVVYQTWSDEDATCCGKGGLGMWMG